jgi:hypothetical protein
MLKIILITGILGLIALIAFVLLGNVRESVPDSIIQPDTSFPDSQNITELPPEDTQDASVVQNFELSPPDYVIQQLPAPGLVTSVVAQDSSDAFDQVLREIFIDVYWILECQLPDGTSEKALILTAQPNTSGSGGEIDLARYAIRNWEPDIAKDIGMTLFPGSGSSLSNTSLTFSNYDNMSRFSTFAAGQNDLEIHYGWVLNFAIFATSHNCLVAAIEDTYAPQSH